MYKVSRNVRVKDFCDFPRERLVARATRQRMNMDLAHLLDYSLAIFGGIVPV
jgi:uncharacterized protein YqiB (DUF1249 family)